jgi:hypothetical protein
LFFRRGLFNDRAFPAIWNVTIPDTTLEQFELEEVEVNPEPPAKKCKTETTERRKAALAAIKKRKAATKRKTKRAHEKARKKEKKEKNESINEDQLPEAGTSTEAESKEIWRVTAVGCPFPGAGNATFYGGLLTIPSFGSIYNAGNF